VSRSGRREPDLTGEHSHRPSDGPSVTVAPVVRVAVDEREAELASDELWRLGATAIEERPSQLVAGFADPESATTAAVALARRWPVEAVDADAELQVALDAWRKHAGPVRAGTRLVVVPTWLPHDGIGGHGDVVLRIDPGRAFGSGSHASTRAALAATERLVTRGVTVLDVGSGSGVLAIAAAVLGALRVVAVDIDAEARRATTANAFVNGVHFGVHASIDDVAGEFDVVLANIGAETLIDLADRLAGHVAPGGALVLAGLLARKWAPVVAAFPKMAVARVAELEGWSTVVLRAAT
jgi:ribosomal protein L11 methyltransferase